MFFHFINKVIHLISILAFFPLKKQNNVEQKGYFEAVNSAFSFIGLDQSVVKEKLVGVTTDGEASNTGPISKL